MPSRLHTLLISSQSDLIAQFEDLLAATEVPLDVIHSPDSIEDEYHGGLDICIIDAKTGPSSALELCQRLRQVQPLTYIACVVDAQDESVKQTALQVGADQVFTLPIQPLEVNAALNFVVRQLMASHTSQKIRHQRPDTFELRTEDQVLNGPQAQAVLTRSEFSLLQAFARAKGQELELWQIYDVLGKNEQTLQKPALEAQISRLRKKLKDAGAGNQALRSMRLKGYQLCCPIWIS